MKIVVFDLDETLGYFTQLGIVWDVLQVIVGHGNCGARDFYALVDLFPECLRPNLWSILAYVDAKKKAGVCEKIMVYTNNHGPKSWAQLLVKYLDTKIGSALFDQVIAAFKVQGKIIELERTTHDKTHADLIRCTKLPDTAEICYLDDTYYPHMVHPDIYYIHVKPYQYEFSFSEMLRRIQRHHPRAEEWNVDTDAFATGWWRELARFAYRPQPVNEDELAVDRAIGHQIIQHLRTFFQDILFASHVSHKTAKRRQRRGHKTMKRRAQDLDT